MKKLLIAALVSGGLVALPAGASAAMSDCSAYRFCIWQNTGFSGTRWEYAFSSTYTYVGSAANDLASSFYNNRLGFTTTYKNYPPTDDFQRCIYINQYGMDMLNWDWLNSSGGDTGQNMNDSLSGLGWGQSGHDC